MHPGANPRRNQPVRLPATDTAGLPMLPPRRADNEQQRDEVGVTTTNLSSLIAATAGNHNNGRAAQERAVNAAEVESHGGTTEDGEEYPDPPVDPRSNSNSRPGSVPSGRSSLPPSAGGGARPPRRPPSTGSGAGAASTARPPSSTALVLQPEQQQPTSAAAAPPQTSRFGLPPALPPMPLPPTRAISTVTVDQARLRTAIQSACISLVKNLTKELHQQQQRQQQHQQQQQQQQLTRRASVSGLLLAGAAAASSAPPEPAHVPVLQVALFEDSACTWHFRHPPQPGEGGGAAAAIRAPPPSLPGNNAAVPTALSRAGSDVTLHGGCAGTGAAAAATSFAASDAGIEHRVARVADALSADFILPTGEFRGDIRGFRARVRTAFATQAKHFQRKTREHEETIAALRQELARHTQPGGDVFDQWTTRAEEAARTIAKQDDRIKSLVKLLERTGVAMKKLERRFAEQKRQQDMIAQQQMQLGSPSRRGMGAGAAGGTIDIPGFANTFTMSMPTAALTPALAAMSPGATSNDLNNTLSPLSPNASFAGGAATQQQQQLQAQQRNYYRQRLLTLSSGGPVDWLPLYDAVKELDIDRHDSATIVRELVELITDLKDQVGDLQVQYDTAVDRFTERDRQCGLLKGTKDELSTKLDEADDLMEHMLADIRRLQADREAADLAAGNAQRTLEQEKEQLQVRVIELESNIARSVESKPVFVGLGRSLAVIPFLRFEGRIKNLDLPKADVEAIIQRIWAKRDPEMSSFRRAQNSIARYLNVAYPGHAVYDPPSTAQLSAALAGAAASSGATSGGNSSRVSSMIAGGGASSSGVNALGSGGGGGGSGGGGEGNENNNCGDANRFRSDSIAAITAAVEDDDITELVDYDNVRFVRRTGTNFIDFVTHLLLDKSASLLYGGEAFDFDAGRVTPSTGGGGGGHHHHASSSTSSRRTGNNAEKGRTRARSKSTVLRAGDRLRATAARDWKNNPSFCVPPDVAEIAYSLMEGCERFKYDADIELFRAIVKEEVSELAWFDQMIMLAKLQAALLQAGRMRSGRTGTATVSVIMQTLYGFFPCKDKEGFTFLRNALLVEARAAMAEQTPKNNNHMKATGATTSRRRSVTPTSSQSMADFDSSNNNDNNNNSAGGGGDNETDEEELLRVPLSIHALFESNRFGNQGPFAEAIRDQHLEEACMYSAELSTAASMCADSQTGRAAVGELREALWEVDPSKSREEIDHFISRVIAILLDEEGVDPFEQGSNGGGSLSSSRRLSDQQQQQRGENSGGETNPRDSVASTSGSGAAADFLSACPVMPPPLLQQTHSGVFGGGMRKEGSAKFGAHELMIMLEEGRQLRAVHDDDMVDCERFAAACRGVFSKRFGSRQQMQSERSAVTFDLPQNTAEHHELGKSMWRLSVSEANALGDDTNHNNNNNDNDDDEEKDEESGEAAAPRGEFNETSNFFDGDDENDEDGGEGGGEGGEGLRQQYSLAITSPGGGRTDLLEENPFTPDHDLPLLPQDTLQFDAADVDVESVETVEPQGDHDANNEDATEQQDEEQQEGGGAGGNE